MYMAEKAPELFPGASFAVAHCNFSLRGEESDADETFVRTWCREHSVPCFVKRFDTAAHASQKGISIEMAARELRYVWFGSLAREQHMDAVAVAHNMGDNAETMILNLLRGSGSKGMRGMSAESSLQNGTPLLRPLLGVTRTEIEDWMRANGKSWREDSSNLSPVYKRNRIRNEVFPIFKEINPSFQQSFSSAMEHFRQVDDIARDYFLKAKAAVMKEEGVIKVKELLELDHWEYVLYCGVEAYGFSEETLSSLERHLLSFGKDGSAFSGRLFVSPGFELHTTREELVIIPRQSRDSAEETGLVVPGPGTYVFGDLDISIEILDNPSGITLDDGDCIYADERSLKFPLTLRHWKEGDFMQPFGMKGHRKLSDIFKDLKLDFIRKGRAVMLADGSRVLAVLPLRKQDESLRVNSLTDRVIRISFTPVRKNLSNPSAKAE